MSRRWRSGLFVLWLIAAACLLWWKWNAIHWFALGDTDDNMRIMQVRGLLHGQAWFDLRQYKLDPPHGANIHWSRLVDLPIAGMILFFRPFCGGIIAEQIAVAVAPLLALGAAMAATALTARRLIDPRAFALAPLMIFFGQSAVGMFAPLRIDHHGWQLAFLALAAAGCADPKRARGGVTVGLATAASMTIGLELIAHMAIAGACIVLRWVADRDEAERLRGYAVSLAAGCTIGFLLFASYDNRAAVCDALSPVWLSVALGAGALLTLLAALRIDDWRVRLALAAVAGGLVAGFYVLAWPHCLGRLEGVSPELYDDWLKNVREAKPIYTLAWRAQLDTVALPLVGLVGTVTMLVRTWATPRFAGWATLAAMSLFAGLLLLWQIRAGPGAQLLAAPGAGALAWMLLNALLLGRHQIAAAIGATALFAGLCTGSIVDAIPGKPLPSRARRAVNTANARCPTIPALRPLAKLPPATILTFVDFGPRLITLTRHKAIAGPYHRNGAAILDIHHAFRSSDPEVAHQVMRRHGATLLLVCPGMSESTIYAAQAPKGFYAQLRNGQIPDWLERIELPAGSPFWLWRLKD